MKRLILSILIFLPFAAFSGTAAAQNFSWKPPGELESGDPGRETRKIWVPGMRVPLLQAPMYANSQVYGHGGSKGPSGSQCHQDNYSYPWWDNYCEPRKWDMPLCPGGNGHQGQDIRPKECKDATYWAVAAEEGTITDDSGVAIQLKTPSGRTHRYLHMKPSTVVVNVGDKLQPGDKIGKVSTYTGGEYPTTIHLHYDIKQYVKSDPQSGASIDSTVFIPLYMSLVDAYSRFVGGGGVGDLYDADLQVELLNGTDRYSAGSSSDVPDFFPGDTVRAAIYLKNASGVNWPTETWLGYWFEDPYLTPTDYQIDTDHPEYDRMTWMRNSADSADENPPKDQLGKTGALLMHAFSQEETKRVTLEMEAGPYSIGAADHPDVRAWMRKIEGIYGVQDGFRKDPSDVNKIGKNIRDYAQLDILSRDHWHFAGTESSELEGWSAEKETKELRLNTKDELLAHRVGGEDARIVSPKWTEIDADAYDELVLRVRSHDGPHRKAIHWSREGENFTDERRVVFEARGDSSVHTYVVPIGDHSKWTGTVTSLRIDLLENRAPASDAEEWYDLGDLFFQTSAEQSTNSRREEYVDQPAVDLVGSSTDETGDTGTWSDAGGGTDPPPNDSDAGTATGGDSSGGRNSSPGEVTTKSTCSTRPSRIPAGWLSILVLLGCFARSRRSSPGRS